MIQVSNELGLAAACCRWPHGPAREAAVREAAAQGIDWPRFDALVARNRIDGLAWNALSRSAIAVPEGVRDGLSARAAAAARAGLALARETIRLQQAFDSAGVTALTVKGVPLAMLAYGDLGIKQSWDIDLLTAPEAAAEGHALLLELGYQMIIPEELNPAQFARFVPHGKEACFRHRESGLVAELHWRLVDNPALLAGIDVHAPEQRVMVAGAALPTLRNDALLAYLCVHGAYHHWSRLKWVADLGALLGRWPGEAIEETYRSAVQFAPERAVNLGLLLCRRLLATPLPEPLAERIRCDTGARALEASVLACLAYGRGAAEHRPYSRAWLRMRIGRLFLGPHRRHLTAELKNCWTSPVDRAQIPLAPGLGFAYHLIRIPMWVYRRAASLARRRSNGRSGFGSGADAGNRKGIDPGILP